MLYRWLRDRCSTTQGKVPSYTDYESFLENFFFWLRHFGYKSYWTYRASNCYSRGPGPLYQYSKKEGAGDPHSEGLFPSMDYSCIHRPLIEYLTVRLLSAFKGLRSGTWDR